MTRLVLNPFERLCSNCPGGATRMVQIPRTKTWICSVCSGFEWHYPTGSSDETTEQEDEYQIE